MAHFFNYGAYANEAVDEMIMASLTELDPGIRSELLADIQTIIIEDAPMVWIAQPHFNLASGPNISGYAHFNDHMIRFQFIDKN